MKHVFNCQGRWRKSALWRSCDARASLFMCGKGPFEPPRRCFEARVGLFKCQGRSRKQFSPLWRCCEARANLFMFGKDFKKPF